MKEMMEKLREASIQAILTTEDVDSLEALRIKYLGKKWCAFTKLEETTNDLLARM